jgi:hypothetical protein
MGVSRVDTTNTSPHRILGKKSKLKKEENMLNIIPLS